MNAPAAESPADLRRQTTRAAGGATGLGFRLDSSASDSASGFGATTLDVLAILSPLPPPPSAAPAGLSLRYLGFSRWAGPRKRTARALLLDPITNIIIITTTVEGHVVASDSLIKVLAMCSQTVDW
ncbi:hypothetical protein B296_00005336 [Ensete ventricosum]|uniref:Uncharacterized protein n=1 Tax=Ensete ventricosum TaxID=4639 RepID=A0A427AZ85_ENSVE|nr:hypothetical protein B296_00005336 [Ensete ventricosum]